MLAPRLLFGGRAAVDACLGRDDCLRTILLHGLSMGMDADPATIDALLDDDEPDFSPARSHGPSDAGERRPGLWTSFVVERDGAGSLHAFDAIVASSRSEAEARLRGRHGAARGDGLEIFEGFDASLPLAEALVSPALADMLEQVASNPGSPLAEGLSVSIQQRFDA